MNAIFDNAVALIGELDIVNHIEGNMSNISSCENKGKYEMYIRVLILIEYDNSNYEEKCLVLLSGCTNRQF